MAFKPDIDPTNGKIDQIKLDGAPEFLPRTRTGQGDVNLEDKMSSRSLISTSKGGGSAACRAGRPSGRERPWTPNRTASSLVAEIRKSSVVMNTENGEVEGSVPSAAGADATGFHDGQAFASCRDGSVPVAEETRR